LIEPNSFGGIATIPGIGYTRTMARTSPRVQETTMSTDTTTIGELALRYASDLAGHLAMVPGRCIAHGQHPQATTAATRTLYSAWPWVSLCTLATRATVYVVPTSIGMVLYLEGFDGFVRVLPVGDGEPATIAADLTHRLS